MASAMIDLTEDRSDVGSPAENASGLNPKNYAAIANMNRYTRSPLKPISNGAREPAKPSLVSDPLKAAIDSVDASRFRKLIKSFCESNPLLREQLEGEFLVRGKDVIRYHPDTESEDVGIDSEEDGDEYDDREKAKKEVNQKRPIAFGDEEMTPRFAKCENCDEEFDVTVNERGDCVWHEGMLSCLLYHAVANTIQVKKSCMMMTTSGPTTIRTVMGIQRVSSMTPTTQKASCGIAVTSLAMMRAASRRSTEPRSISLGKWHQ